MCGLPTCVSEGDPLCLSPFAVIYDNTLYFSQNRKRTVQGQCLRARCPQQRDLEMSRGVRSSLKKSSNLSCVKLKKGPSFRRCENSERAWEGGREDELGVSEMYNFAVRCRTHISLFDRPSPRLQRSIDRSSDDGEQTLQYFRTSLFSSGRCARSLSLSLFLLSCYRDTPPVGRSANRR